MPRIVNPPKRKVRADILERIENLDQESIGRLADNVGVRFQAVYVNIRSNPQPFSLQSKKWQTNIKKALGIHLNEDINEDI